MRHQRPGGEGEGGGGRGGGGGGGSEVGERGILTVVANE